MNTDRLADAERIARFLSKYQTDAGVADPDEKHVLRHSYTTDFFAWLCALLYHYGFGDEWSGRASRAMNAALDVIADERHHPRPLRPAPEFHWEFKNLALINVERLMGDQLSETLRLRLRQELLTWRNLNIDSTNWVAMRALSYEMRYRRFGRVVDRWRSQLELRLVLNWQTPEGFFPDTRHSHSMQYHAYVLSLLALYCREMNETRVREAFLHGVRFVADFVDPAGDFNYYGRGQRQLFGYASLFLALSEAVRLCDHPAEAERYQMLCERLSKFVREHRRPDGVFPVVLNHAGGRWGWYDYNNRGDYLAFCGVWFLLASAVLERRSVTSCQTEVYTRCYQELGLAVAARPTWFAAFSTGGDDLSEPVGLVHLWPHGPLCLGGPEPARAMGVDYQWNYFGPVVNERPILQRQRGKMDADSDAIRLSFSLAQVNIQQTYRWSGGLSFEQAVLPKHGQPIVVPLLIAGASQPLRALRWQTLGQCPSPVGLVTQLTPEACQAAHPFTVGAELAEGEAVPSEILAVQIIRRRHSVWRHIWRTILKAAWVIWMKVSPGS